MLRLCPFTTVISTLTRFLNCSKRRDVFCIHKRSEKSLWFNWIKTPTCFAEVKGKSSHYGLNMLGYTCATRVNSMRSDGEISSKTQKNYPSPDCRLKLVYMKSESLVIVNHNVTVNYLSNFAHTAHHARRVALAGNLIIAWSWGIKTSFTALF